MVRGRHVVADEAMPINSPQAPSTTKESRPCSLTIVMAIFTAFLVLTVAAITFAITYTTSLNTLEDVGQKYAVSLATTASVKVIDIFEGPAQQLRAFGDLLKTDGFHFPSEDTDLYGGVLNRTVTALLPLFLSQPNVYSALGITFDDGSIAAVQSLSSTTFGVYQMNYATISNKTAGCCGAYLATGYDSSNNMARVTYKLLNPAYDARAASYVGLKPLFVTAKDGLWFSTGYLDYSLPGVFYFPGIFPARNASQFLGLISASVSVSSMNNFLKSQTLTPNGYTFMIDLARSVTATSHPASFESLSYTSNYYYTPLVANCVTNAGLYNPVDYHNFTIACRTLASDFPYPPLQQVANDDDLMVPQQSLVFKKITSGGDTYYVAAAQTPNSLQPASVSFKLYLLLFIPESDLIGDVVAARTTVIVIVAAVFVVASVIAAGVIHLVLRPLKSVATKMRSTARLRDVADESEMSQLKEVYDLQLAFRRMNNAIGSFTRYVPRDVVKDLMKSGQLCQIQMVEKTCSMLFVDIASFTTMCERVPPEELSRLVKVYFEQMSTIVTNHEGLIDKYIGDCIMAVWGAPFGCENHEVKAALCGLLIDRETRVDPLVGQFDSAGEQLSVRVGVATGSVLAGNMGSNERMSYTVIGDPVNLAARLESMNKQFGTRVMIDENTAAKCQGVFCLRHLLKIAVVGKEAGISVYEVVGLCADIPTETLQRLRDKRGNQSPTDTASSAQMSSAHSATTFDGSRSAASLLDKARALTEPSPVAPEKAQQRAQVYSLAVDQYLGAKFGDCIRTLDNPLLDAHDKSVVRLLALAEEGARMDSAALARFDGVWHSEEK